MIGEIDSLTSDDFCDQLSPFVVLEHSFNNIRWPFHLFFSFQKNQVKSEWIQIQLKITAIKRD